MSFNFEKKYIYVSFDWFNFVDFTVRGELKTEQEVEVYECIKMFMAKYNYVSHPYGYYTEDVKFNGRELGDIVNIKLVLSPKKENNESWNYTVISDLDVLDMLAMAVIGFYENYEGKTEQKYDDAFEKISQHCT